ncbi:hypothetical protein EV126DRAFT_411200 [Verticillium dahliae]|nr:hypothetical protein EV126DRAFT_411200 [Verticillium dahliae]
MGLSKMSLALFPLRTVVVRWHRLSIWRAGGSLLFASCMTAILCWIQVEYAMIATRRYWPLTDAKCLPAQRIYDSRVEGRCIIEPVPWAIFLGCFCVFVKCSLPSFRGSSYATRKQMKKNGHRRY